MRRSRSRRAFTLVELLVYLALVTTAITVLAGIELMAQRMTAMQQALIDVERESTLLLGHIRRDVEDSRKLELGEGKLVIERLDGAQVVYEENARIERDAQGKVRGRMVFARLTALKVQREPSSRGVRVAATFQKTLGLNDELKRTYERVATPRREVSR